MIHRTFRSLDQAPKLLGFTMGQWAALIAASCAVLGLVDALKIPVKPAITLCVFLIGLPAALAYLSESGGLSLGRLLRDAARWRMQRSVLEEASREFVCAVGVLVLAGEDQQEVSAQLEAEIDPEDDALALLLGGESQT